MPSSASAPALGRASVTGLPLLGASAPRDPARAGIIHLGLGAFHRAHAAVHTARALAAEEGDWGIIGFAHRSRAVVDPMRRQDGLYSVLQLADTGIRADVVDVHRGLGVMTEDPSAVIREIADTHRRLLTLTVSEGGYHVSPRTGHLDLEAPLLREDLAAPSAPRTVIGLLARGLTERARGGEPFTVLPCDNVSAAGQTARRMVTEFLEHSGADDDVLNYVRTQVAFPDAMVDRIVPATSAGTGDQVAELLGVRDEAPVRAEKFSMWVIEDDFPAGRPAWELGGAIMSPEAADVGRYEQVKLRILNGPHSLIAYLGALDGRRTIPESFDQDWIAESTLALIRGENLPTIDLPTGFDVGGYLEDLTHRWHNHDLGHRTRQVGSDGSMRLPQRIPAPALFHLEQGRTPALLALTVAAWFACVVPPRGFEPGAQARAMTDPAQERLVEITAGATAPAEHARALLESGCLTTALAEHEGFVGLVGELLTLLVTSGPRAAAAEARAASLKENH
ncbi:mannitol dehydrogenase family protein [Brachybacterium sacelli]|uniref:Mannitol-1-phosphate 5-dehydrogenase n=2 Tax=Brachybacterium sacelli TaxID=173364 RepID=A0ABS4WYC1_9MICO|nr:mannitol dehydrogenase family protein [Brachybacterium sacelli]MBP2380978.1 fructuronate reductase [Brachybacterium sacelli]